MGTKRGVRTTMSILLCVVLAGAWSPTRARTIYVDDDAPALGDGSSWGRAFQDLQEALAVAQSGDEIRVAQGAYRPAHLAHWPYASSAEYEASFHLVDGTAVLGGFAGLSGADPNQRDPALFTTILTGDLGGDDDPNGPLIMSNYNSRTVVRAWKGHSTLDGVTVTRGKSRDGGSGAGLSCAEGDFLIRNCTFRENWSDDEGTIYNSHGTVRLENCRFLRNESWTGGGLSNWYGTAEVVDCEFIDNYAGGGGGGICSQGNLRIERCRFLRNYGDDGGGALWNQEGSTQVINCEFLENSAHEGAGAIENVDGNVDFFHCLFQGNHASEGAGGIKSSGTLRLLYCTFLDNHVAEHAGALAISGSAAVAHCLFCRNRAEGSGAIYVASASVHLDQCTFYANVSTDEGVGAVYCPSSWSSLPTGSVQARGCIFWANGARREQDEGGDILMTGYREQIGGDPKAVTLEYCCVQAWTPDRGGIGNIGADPLFVAPDQNDFHLKSQAGHWDTVSQAWVADDVTSLCIDAGDPNSPVGPEPFPNGGIVNMGAYGGTSEASKSWFGVEPCPTVNAADLNGDGRVDDEDYRLALLRGPQAGQ